MTHLELRQKFFAFWESKGHVLIPSSSLVPENDPTTLFTGFGMQPLIPYLLGQPHPLGKRLVNIQKCFRGQDIEEVGDNRHDSFFEMMGNWSLGDYFKKDQLTWYLEFLTDVLGFPKGKLYVTCFEGNKEISKDTESEEIWKNLGISQDHIKFYGVDKNWWSRSGTPEQMPVGEIGGPDSEVFYDFGAPIHDGCHPNCNCGRFIEIGNSVFIQYQKQSDGSFKELPQKNVDFGGGLERTLAALNNDPDIFHTDLYTTLLHNIVVENEYQSRVVADHLKAAVFLIADGVIPSNKDRGYILRRLIRRAARFSESLDQVDGIINIYRELYPQLVQKKEEIKETLRTEEKKFRQTLDRGLKEFAKISQKGSISPQEAFYLYESLGFPYELTQEESQNKNIKIASRDEFDEEVKKHQGQSRTASAGTFKGGLADHSEIVTKYHTATHLLHAALRKILGDTVCQQGSNLTAERLRFDFSYSQKLTIEEIKKVEGLVNEQINRGLVQKTETMSFDEAIKSGALAFFKEKYPEKVTVYTFGDFSREVCGGPHVENTKTLGQFEILKEESVSSGIRRLYARLHFR